MSQRDAGGIRLLLLNYLLMSSSWQLHFSFHGWQLQFAIRLHRERLSVSLTSRVCRGRGSSLVLKCISSK